MAQPGNYLSPGIDERNQETIEWLHKRGYSRTDSACNLLISLRNNPNVTNRSLERRKAKLADLGYEILRLPKARIRADLDLISECFSKGWAFELARASLGSPRNLVLNECGTRIPKRLAIQTLDSTLPSEAVRCFSDEKHQLSSGAHIAIAVSNKELAGFAGHDGNNRGLGWFGPTGTLEKHRGQGIAAALLIACLLDIKNAGHERAEVAWIGPRGFYEKVAGVASDRKFAILSKSLGREEKREEEREGRSV